MSTSLDERDAAARPWYRRDVVLDTVGLLARLFLGTVLIVAGAVKVGHPLTSQRAVQAYEIMPMTLAGYVGLALPFVEVVLGVLLVVGLLTRPVAAVSTLLMVAFVVGIAQAWARGLTIDCGCFGGGGQIGADETKYPQEIARDASFAAAGVWLWWRPRSLAALDRLLFGH
ncbi:MauE/DoxX family redox-associated membrane protein [uncultured Phycicoccus sp.]|uniref:MauE/DoxX family redox-associated membrane protein n=1 Tax=uncultured Phycicoccus sp. TaxID=661422 RepID=UPI002635BDF6|nr:MauE/DoxX family redox-associated membrane protein [uncultured Phycicoccus sp.]